MDMDNSGKLEYSEFRRALERYNLQTTDEEFGLLVKHFDVDGDGILNYAEFQKHFAKFIQGEFNGHAFADANESNLNADRLKVNINAVKAGVAKNIPLQFSPISVRRRGSPSSSSKKTLPPVKVTSPSKSRSSPKSSSRPPTARTLTPAQRSKMQDKLRRANVARTPQVSSPTVGGAAGGQSSARQRKKAQPTAVN